MRFYKTNIKTFIISLFIIIPLLFNLHGQGNDDVELRIDFTSGAVIANEKPKVINSVVDISIPLGKKDSVIADLNEVFNDAESGSQLNYSARSLKPSLLEVQINGKDSTVKVIPIPGKTGKTKIILSASDGNAEVYDTVSILIKKLFKLNGNLNDTIIKSSDTATVFEFKVSHILPISSSEKYSISASSNNNALLNTNVKPGTNNINLIVIDSGYGNADIEVVISDSDQLSVKDTFTVTVMKSYSKKKYYRKKVSINPGISLFTSTYYSGASLRLWVKDIFGISISGYYQWDQNGIGADGQLMLKPSLNFFLQPYITVGGGYLRHTEIVNNEYLNINVKKDIPIFPVHGAGGIEAWLGMNKRHVIGIEAGYRYGEAEYQPISILKIGSKEMIVQKEKVRISPLYLRFNYSFFLKKL